MRKKVKNGFVDAFERTESVKRSNPFTHDIDNVQVKVWEFIPSMLPDDAEMPKSPDGWDAQFERLGKKLSPLRATHHSEIKNIMEKCEVLIQEAYDAKYNPPTDPYRDELSRLGFK